MTTGVADSLFSTINSTVGSSIATNLGLILVVLAGLFALGFAISRFRKYIAKKG